MKLLAIETSCDETAVAVLEANGDLDAPRFEILGNALVSQIQIHQEFGGVVPNLAKREHEKNLPILISRVLKEANLDENNPDIDYLTVTVGPGLAPALWVGVEFAENLAKKWNKPILGTNHMEGHIFSVLYQTGEHLILPALALLVSGGHTELVYVKDYGSYQILGRTRDDAVGEAFDKVARMLDLPYPGGPQISKLANLHRQNGLESKYKFPMPMIHSKDLDFSFSGLKTSVLYKIKTLPELSDEDKANIARGFEDSAIGVLVEKTIQALDGHSEIKTLIVGGGVSANSYLRSELERVVAERPDVKLWMPERSLSTDNAVMIGMTSYLRVLKDPQILSEKQTLKASGNLSL